MRLTVAADGNIWITGHLNYRVEPRGADGIFSEPIPGDATGTSADDQLDVQNVLGVVSWATPTPWVPTARAGGIRLSSALTGNLQTHGMVFVANLSGQAEPSGQFSFDDPNGTYRGESLVLGGVVQKTMGTFGQPSSNTGLRAGLGVRRALPVPGAVAARVPRLPELHRGDVARHRQL